MTLAKTCCKAGFTVFLCLVTGACVAKHLRRDLIEQNELIRRDAEQFVSQYQYGGSTPISWKRAHALLKERNLQYLQAKQRLGIAKKRRDEQWKTWLPRFSAYGSLERSLADLGDLSFSDISLRAYAPLNIPNPVSERARAFENALGYLQAKDSMEQSYRQQVVVLYRLFSRHAALVNSMHSVRASASPVTLSLEGGLSEIQQERKNKEQLENIEAEIARMINYPGKRFTPIAKTMPALDYRGRIHQMVLGKNVGRLAMRMYAYQLEGSLLRLKGVKFQQLPTWALSGSMPALYDSNSRSGAGEIDTESVRLFSSLAYSYDLTGRQAEMIDSAEENVEFIKKNLRQTLSRETREWLRLKSDYSQVLQLEDLLKARSKRMMGSSEMSAIAKLGQIRELQHSLAAADRQREQMELELWLWDDTKWE